MRGIYTNEYILLNAGTLSMPTNQAVSRDHVKVLPEEDKQIQMLESKLGVNNAKGKARLQK